jgi:hypothetical protein
MSEKDPFDDIESLMMQPTEAVLKAQEESSRRARMDFPAKPKLWGDPEPYVIVPLRLAAAMSKELSGAHWAIFVNLYYRQAVLNKGHPIPASAQTTGCARSRTRHEALRRLEKLGLIKVDWKPGRAAPIIKIAQSVRLRRRGKFQCPELRPE